MNPPERKTRNRFERHAWITLSACYLFGLVLLLLGTEFILRRNAGLGDPVLYVRDPGCGYRLRPNQEKCRFYGASFRINNLGLRSQQDWDEQTSNKILFLGDSVTYGGSHIGNEALFSEIAVQALDGYLSGNAGVPAWGVENVHGLIVVERFLPAGTYVSTFIEGDFYRGLVQADMRPEVWFESPRYALRETGFILWCWALTKLDLFDAFYPGIHFAEDYSEEESSEHAAAKLKEMDVFLRTKGFTHLIYISPTRGQVMGQEEPDARVASLLQEQGVRAEYLLERLQRLNAGTEERASWYKDHCHLTTRGHRVWGERMGEDLRKTLGHPPGFRPPGL